MRQNVFITTFLVSISCVAVAHAAALRTVALTGQHGPWHGQWRNYDSFGAHLSG